jgi:cytosine/adenosine deaminase-related metal-dependent hydrolase
MSIQIILSWRRDLPAPTFDRASARQEHRAAPRHRTLSTALKMASRVPAEFLGLDKELGRIALGYRANLVLLDGELKAAATWIDGSKPSISGREADRVRDSGGYR